VIMARSHWLFRALVCILVLFSWSCSDKKVPTDTLRAFMGAVESFDLDTAQSLVCDRQRAQVQESLAFFDDVTSLSEAFDMRFEDLEFTERSNDGAVAVVLVTGKAKLAFLGKEDVQDVYEEHVLENVDGRWVICDP